MHKSLITEVLLIVLIDAYLNNLEIYIFIIREQQALCFMCFDSNFI